MYLVVNTFNFHCIFPIASAYPASVQYEARGAIWPNDWHSSGNTGVEQSSSVSAQCRQSALSEVSGQRSMATAGREQFVDLIGGLGSSIGNQSTAEYGDLASMFTGFIE